MLLLLLLSLQLSTCDGFRGYFLSKSYDIKICNRSLHLITMSLAQLNYDQVIVIIIFILFHAFRIGRAPSALQALSVCIACMHTVYEIRLNKAAWCIDKKKGAEQAFLGNKKAGHQTK